MSHSRTRRSIQTIKILSVDPEIGPANSNFGQLRGPIRNHRPSRVAKTRELPYSGGQFVTSRVSSRWLDPRMSMVKKNRENGRSWEKVQAGTLPCLGISIF